MQKQKKKRMLTISIFILEVTITTLLAYLIRIGLHHKRNFLEVSADKGDVYLGEIETSDGFYDNEEKLLSIGDECNFSPRGFEVIKSRFSGSFKDLNGFMTLAYFYKYQCESTVLNFSYNCKITNGKCKLIIIDSSKEKIVTSIDLNGEGNKDVEINKTGNYYVRLVGEEASGDIEVNASGPNIVYHFTVHQDKVGLYDYN